VRDLTFALNAQTLPYWKRPAELLAIIEAVKAKHDAGWIKSSGQLQMTYRELWQGAVAYYGMELAKGRQYRLHPSFQEPYDYFAALIDVAAWHADYVAVQSKSIWNFNRAETNDFQPELLAEFIHARTEKYGTDPSITFMFYVNADAVVDHVRLHACLKERLSGEYPVWLYGLETNQDRTRDNWYLRYVYPGFRESGKHVYAIENLPPNDDREVKRYMDYIESVLAVR
jgi:hypothetical protein